MMADPVLYTGLAEILLENLSSPWITSAGDIVD
jgi:hypothetical protein